MRIFRLMVCVFAFSALFASSASAAEVASPSAGQTGPTHAELVARIKRIAEEKRPPKFSELPLAVWKTDTDDGVAVSTPTFDPLMPKTLDVYFPEWYVTARARLLLDHAQWYEASASADGVQSADEQLRLERALQDHARIRAIMTRGDYELDWLPFRTAYAEFVVKAKEVAIDSRTLQRENVDTADPFAALIPGDKLAQDFGLYRLIAETRISPDDVAEEMLRLVTEARERMGGEAAHADLLYTCKSPKSSKASAYPLAGVRVRAWHTLAPAFFKAVMVDNDPQAEAVKEVYRQIASEFGAWREAHADAGSAEESAKLRELAGSHNLRQMLEQFNR